MYIFFKYFTKDCGNTDIGKSNKMIKSQRHLQNLASHKITLHVEIHIIANYIEMLTLTGQPTYNT